MAYTSRVAVLFCTLVLLQVSYSVSKRVNVPAVMTVNGFQQGEGGGGPAACDGQYHSDQEIIVSLSTKWYAGGKRCGKSILITAPMAPTTMSISAVVVDECRGCHSEVGASPAIWDYFGVHTNAGEMSITWSDMS